MTRIVFLDRGTIGPKVDLIRPAGAHDWVEYPQTREDQVLERLRGASVAVTNKVPLRRSTLEQLPDLKFISVAATGYDVIDIEACRALGITVSNVRGYAVHSVPEHVMAMILSLKRQLAGYRADVLAGKQRLGVKLPGGRQSIRHGRDGIELVVHLAQGVAPRAHGTETRLLRDDLIGQAGDVIALLVPGGGEIEQRSL